MGQSNSAEDFNNKDITNEFSVNNKHNYNLRDFSIFC